MQSASNSDTEIIVWLNGEPLSFDPEQDYESFAVEPGHIEFKVLIPESYDPGGVSLSIGDDIGFRGFQVRLYPLRGTKSFTALQEDLESICGMRLIGRSSINVLYHGVPLIGYSSFVNFLPRKEIQKYVEIMRQDFEKDLKAITDLYGLTQEEFEFESINEDAVSEPSFLQFMLIVQLYRSAKAFLNLRIEELDSTFATRRHADWLGVHEAGRISTQQLRDAYSAAEPFFPTSVGGTGSLPLKVPVNRNQISFNTVANRYMYRILLDIENELLAIFKLLSIEFEKLTNDFNVRESSGSYTAYHDFKVKRLRHAQSVCNNFFTDVRRMIKTLSEVGVYYDNRAFLQTVNLKKSYRILISGYQRYKSRVRLIMAGGNPWVAICSLHTRSVNYLYELWVAQYILNLLVKKLGFRYVDEKTAGDRSVTKLNSRKPIELETPDGRQVRFYYGRKFPHLDNPFCLDLLGVVPRVLGGETRAVAKDNPDICIEFYNKNDKVPKILVFDATFSNNPLIHKEKGYYKQLIWYRPSVDSSQAGWRRVVLDSIAVHPYKQRDELPLEGEWALPPGEDPNNSGRWLSDLLQLHGLVD